MKLAGKVALVTGAAGGFGAGIASLFAQEGAKLVLAELDAVAVQGDVSRGPDVAAMVAANACLFLAQPESSFITGVLLPVDGGRCV